MPVTPSFHQRFQLGIVPVGKHDAGGEEKVAGAADRFRQPFALEPKNPAARGILRYRQLDGVAQCRCPNLAAQHRLIKRDRQIDPQIAAVDLEEGVRRDADRDQEIAGAMAGGGLPLPLQADLLAGSDPGRNLDI
jgi:hypothetical protein